jgi:hypothetical protein
MTIEPTTFVFGIRGVQTARHAVKRVYEEPAPTGRGYELRCVNQSGQEIGVHLVLNDGRGRKLYLRHRPKVIWTREEAIR